MNSLISKDLVHENKTSDILQYIPSLISETAVSKINVVIVIDVEIVGESERNSSCFGGERSGQPTLRANCEEAEVSVRNIEIIGPFVESQNFKVMINILPTPLNQ